MVDTLQDEGYQINDRELIRLRLRLKLLLRESVPRPRRRQTSHRGTQKESKSKKAKTLPGKGLITQLGNAILADSSGSSESSEDEEATYSTIAGENAEDIRSAQPAPESPSLDPEESLRRQLRLGNDDGEREAGLVCQQTRPVSHHDSHPKPRSTRQRRILP
jgi:hypothetical protein